MATSKFAGLFGHCQALPLVIKEAMTAIATMTTVSRRVIARAGKEWSNLFFRKEPILEVVAGLVDGSISARYWTR